MTSITLAASGRFDYPGDDPAALVAAADHLELAAARVDRLTQSMELSRQALRQAWTTQATELADADIGVLATGLPTVRSRLDTARAAVLTHRGTLARIRADVDELRIRSLQAEHAIAAAQAQVDDLSARTDPMSGLLRESAVDAGQAATASEQSVADAYQQLVHRANASAQNCADSLTSAWDPAGRSRGAGLADPGGVLLAQGGISVSSLSMLRIQRAVGEAIALSTDIDRRQLLTATDPALQERVARLAAIWDEEGSNGVFATEFFAALGADDTVDLLARVGTLIQPTGPAGTGAITPELIRSLQADLGVGLAMSTAGIQYGADGSLQDTEPGGLPVDWLTALMARGRSQITVPWNDLPIQVSGYVPLMATLAHGEGFSAGLLRALGDDMREVERQYDTHGEGVGDSVWNSTAPLRVRWDWGIEGTGFPMGNDPFTSWTAAMMRSPRASTTVLATDPVLLNHLLNGRSWLLRDSGADFGAAQWLYRVVGEDEPLEGLAAFGNALPAMVGQGALTEDSAVAFNNVVRALGDKTWNYRIDAGDFQDSDWIPPELRPGVGTMLTLNVDTLNTVFAVPNTVGSEAFSRVLADAAKVQGIDVNGHSVIDRVMSAEYSVIAAKTLNGDVDTADLDAQARIAATLSHGHGAANIGLQQASDAAHNASVAKVAGVVQLGLDHSPAPVGWTTQAYQLFGGDLMEGLTSQFTEDTALPARNGTADFTGSLADEVTKMSANQWYAAVADDLPAPDSPGVQLLDPGGRPYAWTELDQTSRDWAVRQWPIGREKPEEIGSRAWTVFDGQAAAMKSYRVPYSDGT